MFYLLYVYLSPLISDAFGFQVRFCQTSISMQELQNVVLEVTESLPILWEHWHSSFVDRRTNMVHPKPLKSTVNHRGRQRCDKHFYDLLCHIGKSFGLSICPFHFRMDSPRWTAHNANRAFALRVHNLPILGLAELQRMDPQLREMIKRENWKRCPVCRHLCERESGCNFMTCPSEQCNFGRGEWTLWLLLWFVVCSLPHIYFSCCVLSTVWLCFYMLLLVLWICDDLCDLGFLQSLFWYSRVGPRGAYSNRCKIIARPQICFTLIRGTSIFTNDFRSLKYESL